MLHAYFSWRCCIQIRRKVGYASDDAGTLPHGVFHFALEYFQTVRLPAHHLEQPKVAKPLGDVWSETDGVPS